MQSVLIVVAYTLANLGCGYSVLRTFFRPCDIPLSIQFALGTAVLSSLFLILGLFGQLHYWAIMTVVLAMALLSVCSILSSMKSFISKKQIPLSYSLLDKNVMYSMVLVLSVLVMCWFGILAFVRPPFGDTTAFYMVYPKLIAATGKLIAMPGNYHDFSAIGLNGELHYTALMVISTPAVAKFFTWIVGVGILFLLSGITQSIGGSFIAQVSAVTMLISSTAYMEYLSDGKTDLFALLSGLAAIYTLFLCREKHLSNAYIVLAGLLTGFALVAKFSYVIAFLPGVVFLLFYGLNLSSGLSSRKRYKSLFSQLMLLGVGIFIALVPHLLKNYVLFGNSLAPFIGMKSNFTDMSAWYSLKDTLWIVATYPLALVLGIYPLMGGNFSLLWLASIPLILFLPKSELSLRNPVVQLTLSGLIGLFFWIALKASVFVPRYFLATLVMLIPLPALAVEYLWQHENRPRFISICFAIISTVILLCTPFFLVTGIWTELLIKNFSYIKNVGGNCNLEISTYCNGFNALNKEALPGARVFVVGYHTYWLRDDLLQCINTPDEYNLIDKTTDAEIWSKLFDQGFIYIAVQKPTHKAYLKKLDPEQAPSWLSVSSQFLDSDMPIFHLRSTDPLKKPNLTCAQRGKKDWRTS